MLVKMGQLPIQKVFLNTQTINEDGEFEFIIDCEAIYFDATYDNDGQLQSVEQYFYTQANSHDDMDIAEKNNELLNVDSNDFSAKTFLLAKHESGNEWLRFHAVVPQSVNTDYFYQKYIGE